MACYICYGDEVAAFDARVDDEYDAYRDSLYLL